MAYQRVRAMFFPIHSVITLEDSPTKQSHNRLIESYAFSITLRVVKSRTTIINVQGCTETVKECRLEVGSLIQMDSCGNAVST